MSAVSLLYCFYCQGWLTFESQRHNRNHLFNVIKMLLASFHPVLVAFGGFFSKELNLWSAAAPNMLAWQKQSDQKHPPLES